MKNSADLVLEIHVVLVYFVIFEPPLNLSYGQVVSYRNIVLFIINYTI